MKQSGFIEPVKFFVNTEVRFVKEVLKWCRIGEFVNNYEMAVRIVRNADVFVVIGTSLTVTLAADLIKCPRYGVPKFIINPCEPFDPYDDNYPEGYVHIREKATSGIETFIDRMMTL